MRCKLSLFSAIATSVSLLAIAPPTIANTVKRSLQESPHFGQINSWQISQLPQTAALIYVAPNANPNGDGSPNKPYASITQAIAANPTVGTVIQLQQGVYGQETGEVFPLRIPTGVILRGDPSSKGANTIIRGGGKFVSTSFASQNVAIVPNSDVRIEGITVTNPNTRGTAIWIETGKRVLIANNNLSNSNREGLFLTGTADASVSENIFKNNGANGLSAVGSSTGEIKNNLFEKTGFGLAIGQRSRVNIIDNRVLNNTDGIVISNLSAPTLRNNLITDNKRSGLVILKDRQGYPTPDLGTDNSLGNNTFRNNLGKDISNSSGVTQVAVGNKLDPKKIAGNIAFVGATPTAPLVATNAPTSPAPVNVSPPVVNSPPVPSSPKPNTVDSVEITRSPEPVPPVFQSPAKPPVVLAPPKVSPNTSVQSLPSAAVPTATAPRPTTSIFIPSTTPSKPPASPKPVMPVPTKPVSPAPVITPPQSNPSQVAAANSATVAEVIPQAIPYNPQLAAIVPPPANENYPYLVIIPSADRQALNLVRSAVPIAKIIPSRFGDIIFVQGYPDRDRAEVLKVIVRSGVGLDARVIHQNSL